VLLDNENLLEGEVSKVEDGYQIKRSVGDVTIPANRVLAVVADRKAAFAAVSQRANLRDADERLRLARWCSANGLPDEALSEARTAARMRPGFKAAEQLAAALEANAQLTPAPVVTPAKAEVAAKDTVTDVPTVEYNSESFPLYASRVNTILLNTCASCHGPAAKGFRLTRGGGRAGLNKNLMSALAQVNPSDPAASPLLVKAVTAHGNATTPPFRTKAHPAYQTLETWVRFCRAPEGTLEPLGPLEPARPEPKKLPDLGAERVPAAPPAEAFGKDSPSKPVKTQADDPFDPAIFNGELRKK
jgi:hypothetical protein